MFAWPARCKRARALHLLGVLTNFCPSPLTDGELNARPMVLRLVRCRVRRGRDASVRGGWQWVGGTAGRIRVVVWIVGLRIGLELRWRVEWVGVRRVELGIVERWLVERLELGRVLERLELGIVERRLVERLEL